MADSSPPATATEQKLVQLNTHQAKNLETIKNDAQWFRERADRIDGLATERAERIVKFLESIDRKLWHVVLWLYVAVVLTALAIVYELTLGPY